MTERSWHYRQRYGLEGNPNLFDGNARVAPDYVAGLRAPTRPSSFATMRDLETIDSELRLLAVVRRSIREHGGEPGESSDRRIARRARSTAGSIWGLTSSFLTRRWYKGNY